MKLLILGCNGMAGHTISLFLKEQGHCVVGFDRVKSKIVDSVAGDAFDTESLRRIIEDGSFDSIINCIGILNRSAEINKANAAFLNAYFPHFLEETTKEMDTQIIHLSTDCVFSGKRGEYTEEDLRDGESFYARSKALGELENNKDITLRSSIVGPDMNPEGIGLLNWFMQQSGEVSGYTQTMWTGQTSLQLAKTIENAAKTKAHGLYNTVPDHPIAKYELLNLFNRYLRREKIAIKPTDGITLNKSLKRTKFDFDYLIPDYEIMIKELADWMLEYKDLYPHYKL